MLARAWKKKNPALNYESMNYNNFARKFCIILQSRTCSQNLQCWVITSDSLVYVHRETWTESFRTE